MTRAEEIRYLIGIIGISQREAAKALEIDERTFRYWCAANPEPPLMAILALQFLKESNEWRDSCSDAA